MAWAELSLCQGHTNPGQLPASSVPQGQPWQLLGTLQPPASLKLRRQKESLKKTSEVLFE